MYSILTIPERGSFNYWFRGVPNHGDLTWEVMKNSNDDTVLWSGRRDDLPVEYTVEFSMFQDRPEYSVYMLLETELSKSDVSLPEDELYEKYLVGATLIHSNSDGYLQRVERLLKWIRGTDMYEAPASTIYHDCAPGGLLSHTMNVVNKTTELLQLPTFADVNIGSAVMCALVHDWCKINTYEKYMRNVKNDETGRWESVPSYRRKEAPVPLAHGPASAYIAQKFLPMSMEQVLAVQHHMGMWRCHQADVNELQYANENYPLVHLLQMADQLSIVKY